MTEWRAWQVWAVLTAVLYGVLAWIWFTQLMPEAGGLTPFDGHVVGYSQTDAEAFLEALSAAGREIYTGPVRTLDTVFPIALAILMVWPLWRQPRGFARLCAVFPMVYLCADLAENAAVGRFLANGTMPDVAQVAWASAMTQVKFASLGLSVIALLVVFVRTRQA